MKITQEQLKQIIAEELDEVLGEGIGGERFRVRLYHHMIGTWYLSSVEEAIQKAKQMKHIPFEEFSISFNAPGSNPMYPNSSVLKSLKMSDVSPQTIRNAKARVYYTKADAEKAGAWQAPYKEKKKFHGPDQSDFGGYSHSSRNREE